MGGGRDKDCAAEIGFDCSGLIVYVMARGGFDRTWGCIMRARSAWVGTPEHFYPLGAGHRAVGDAIAALTVLQTIAVDSGLDR